MDAGLWVALCSALAAVASAVFAYVQAKAATDSRQDAKDSEDVATVARDAALDAMRAAAASSALAAAATAASVDVNFELTLSDGEWLVVVVENAGATVFVHGFSARSVGMFDLVEVGTTHWMPVASAFRIESDRDELPKRLHQGEYVTMWSEPRWDRPMGYGEWAGISGVVYYSLDGGTDPASREVRVAVEGPHHHGPPLDPPAIAAS